MAKDPAMLWYWNDWTGGTMTLTRHQKGCYIDLLAAQFNQGPLSLEQVKTLLGTDQASWTVLRAKFKKKVNSDGIEVFFNERMVTEKEKRRLFSKKQTEKVNKRWQKDTPVYTPVIPKIENENENGIEDENKIKNDFVNTNSKKEEFLTNQKWKEQFCMAKNIQMAALEKLQKEFIIDTDLKGEFVDSYKRYFTNWFNSKHNGTHQHSFTKSSVRKSSGAEKLLNSLKDDIAGLRPGQQNS